LRARLRAVVALAAVLATFLGPTAGPATAGWNDGGNKCPAVGCQG
jgi:hypothetical protein